MGLDQFVEKFGPPVRTSTTAWWKFICPECSRKALTCNIEIGFINCFHCGYQEQIKVSGTSTYKRPVVDQTLQQAIFKKIVEITDLEPHYKTYLTKRGVYNYDQYQLRTVPYRLEVLLNKYFTKDELTSSGLFHLNTNGSIYPSLVLSPRRILIPYLLDGEIVSCRSRENPFNMSDTDYKYASPTGSESNCLLWHRNLSGDVIFTEGELKAMACIDAGTNACSVSGVGKAKSVIPRLAKLLNDSGTTRLFIIFDSDVGWWFNDGLIKMALTVAKAFRSMGAVFFLPMDNPGEKMDLDLFISRYGGDYLRDILEDVWKQRTRYYERLTVREQFLTKEKSMRSPKG